MFLDTIDSQWVAVDLQKIQRVTGIITQGQGHNNREWVTSLKIEYGTIAGLRRPIVENNIAKVLRDAYTKLLILHHVYDSIIDTDIKIT